MTLRAMKTLIVDDERLARKRLSRQLSQAADVELIGECRSVSEATKVVAQGGADLLFLDVEMPRASGIDLARALERLEKAPAVVFVTAHERYAVQAFELRACDYLLKPVSDDRLQLAVTRAREMLGLRDGAPEEPAAVVLARSSSGVQRIKLEGIDWIEAAGNYVELHVGGASHLLRETIASFEARLPRDRFARIHRNAIANLDRIVEFQPLLSGDFEVVLQCGKRLRMSRTYRQRIRDVFGRSI
jgi:two-component system LytT family response regulator